MPTHSFRLLAYALPFLLNGLLYLLWYVKDKNVLYTMIAQGLGFSLVIMLVAFLLNGVGVVWSIRTRLRQ